MIRSLPILTVLAALIGACLGQPATAADAPAWTIEDGSAVGFVASQGGGPVEGRFENFEAEISFDPDAPEAGRVSVEIDIASVNSESQERDDTIRSASLFDVATWPTARFAADRFSNGEGGGFEAQGTLTMRDVTREVVLPFTLEVIDHPDLEGELRARAVGEIEVLRLDYGVGQGMWQDTSVVANEVVIKIDIVARRPKS